MVYQSSLQLSSMAGCRRVVGENKLHKEGRHLPCTEMRHLALFVDIYILFKKQAGVYYPGGGGGNSHVKVTRMLVVSLKGVNCRFWSHAGCLEWKVTIFDHSGIA